MQSVKLRKEGLQDFFKVMGDKPVYAPKKDGNAVKFAPLADVKELHLVGNSTVPCKSVVFPQTQTLFQFIQGDTEMDLPGEEKEGVVWGVRPCDARALAILDPLFAWDVDDPYYREKRDKFTLIGLSCQEPCQNCFCTSVGGGPASTEGLDLLATDLGEEYLLQPVTAKGEDLCQAAREVLEKAGQADDTRAGELHRKAKGMITRKIDTEGLPEKLPGLWDHELWQKISAACLGCGICTYMCPTCHCFDIQDELEGYEGRRCRMWDSCMFSEYSLHASGHNPRPTRRERTRNRINHKYSYYVEKFNVIACVGCGRCISHCPVNIDILDILSKAREAL